MYLLRDYFKLWKDKVSFRVWWNNCDPFRIKLWKCSFCLI